MNAKSKMAANASRAVRTAVTFQRAAWDTKSSLRRGGGGHGVALELDERVAQRADDFVARDLAAAELNAHVIGRIGRVIVENVGMRTRFGFVFFLADAARFIAREAALRDVHDHIDHLFFVGLARDLEEQRFGDNPLLQASL